MESLKRFCQNNFFASNELVAEAIQSVHPQNLPTMQTDGHFKGRGDRRREQWGSFGRLYELPKRLIRILINARTTSLSKIEIPVRNRKELHL